MNWAAALQNECPRCRAAPHERCRGTRGERKAHHIERYGGDVFRVHTNRGVRASRCNEPGYIYFLGAPATNSVKIGFSSKHPKTRVQAMQTGNADELLLIGSFAGTMRDERELHARFAEYCIRGEWFRFEGDVEKFYQDTFLPGVFDK